MKDYLLYWKPSQPVDLVDYITVVLHGCSYAKLDTVRHPVQEIDDGIVGRIDLKGDSLCLVFQSGDSSILIVYVQVENEQAVSDMDVGMFFSFIAQVQACLESGKAESGARIGDQEWIEVNRSILEISKKYKGKEKPIDKHLKRQEEREQAEHNKTTSVANKRKENTISPVVNKSIQDQFPYYYELTWEMRKSVSRDERDRFYQGIGDLFTQVCNRAGVGLSGNNSRTVKGEEQCDTVYNLNGSTVANMNMSNSIVFSFKLTQEVGDTAAYSIIETMINIFVQIEQYAVKVKAKRNGAEWYEANVSEVVRKYAGTS